MDSASGTNTPDRNSIILRPTSGHSSILTEDETVFPGNSPVEPKFKWRLHRAVSNTPTDSSRDKSFNSKCSFSSESEELEALESSIIWHIYNEEASKFDTSMIDGSHREIDVLLVFTGLFSAVLTTFIIQVYQMILPDPMEKTNDLLSDLMNMQAKGDGLLFKFLAVQTNMSDFSHPGINNNQGTSEPNLTQIRWVNGLWFSALACSLSTALISMLAKQWLHAYTRGIAGSPRHRARMRQNRFIHFRSWHVLTVVNSLPLLLHAALFLFFGGVIVLLWMEEVAISMATTIVVALAYIFYIGSMWISLISPDCPYQHPISAHLHHWLKPGHAWSKSRVNRSPVSKSDLESCGSIEDLLGAHSMNHGSNESLTPAPDDTLDATALIWLLKDSGNPEGVRCSVLQAIALFPRDFTAFVPLRQAGAIEMILERFESCFHLDSTLGMQWYIRDSHAAGKYCRAWMRLTYQTKLKWPARLIQPLHMLCELTSQPAVSAAATCILALTSPEQYSPQIELLSLLSRHLDRQARLSWSTQHEVLDALLECVANWELSAAVLADIVSRAVPILIRLLHELGATGPWPIRRIVNLNLYALTGNFLENETRRDENRRKDIYCCASVGALSSVVEKRACYGVEDDELLDIVAVELSRLAGTLVTKPQNFSQSLHESAKAAFTSLYLERRLTTREVAEEPLADILYLLHPPILPETGHQAFFAYDLIHTLKHTKHPNIVRNVFRLLESHLTSYFLSTVDAFMDGGGLDVLLQIANAGNIDSRQLQMHSLRVLCTFVQISATQYFEDEDNFSPSYFDTIFQSDFLKTLCAVVTTRKWWLADVAHVWAPALLKLCRVRPDDPSWQNVERTFWKYAGLHQTESGQGLLLKNLNHIRDLRRELEGGVDKSFFEEDF